MQLLEGLKRLGQRLFVEQFLGFLAKLDFGIEVLLHVEVAQLSSDSHLVEELFNEEMVVVPQVGVFGSRHRTDFFPAVLKGMEIVVGLLQRLIGSDDLFQFLEEGLFLGEVFLLLVL